MWLGQKGQLSNLSYRGGAQGLHSALPTHSRPMHVISSPNLHFKFFTSKHLVLFYQFLDLIEIVSSFHCYDGEPERNQLEIGNICFGS